MSPATRSCSSCGAELPRSARFCRACGGAQGDDAEARGDAIEEAAAPAQPRPTIAGRSRFPLGRLLLVLAVGGVIAYFAISGGGSESDTAKADRLAAKFPRWYSFGQQACAGSSLAELRLRFGTTLDADRAEIASAIQTYVGNNASGDPLTSFDKGFTAVVGCFDAWGGLIGREKQPLNTPPGGST